MAGKKLVLFDFDGTITTKDTMFLFTRFVVGTPRFLFGMLMISVPLILHKLRIVGAQKAKEIMLTQFFKGMSKDVFDDYGKRFTKIISIHVRPAAIAEITNHKSSGARIIVVSASAENWIKPWCTNNGLEFLATQLETRNGKLTGKIEGRNCNADEKVNRIKQLVQLSDYSEIIAYGDTSGDLPMLSIATEKHFKPFRDKTN